VPLDPRQRLDTDALQGLRMAGGFKWMDHG
jgi:hypothetical protein